MYAAHSFVAFCLRIIAIAVTNVAFAWTMLGCAPGAIHVATADSTAFQRMLEADVAADARRAAIWMEPRARRRLSRQASVLNDDKLPEAYTVDGERGRWASQYHLSYAALRLIREHYAATHPAHRQLDSDDLVDVVDEAGGNTHSVNVFERDRQLDIADVDGRFVFEVVPPGPTHEAAGKKKVDWELLLLNKAMLGVPEFTLGTGYSGEIGLRFAEGTPAWKLSWQTIDPGVISYHWHVLSVGEATEHAHREAYLDNRWHAPTIYETTLFGRALHQVVEKLVQAREELGQTRAATEMPMLPGQTIADYQRSVALWSDYDDPIARLLPLVRPDVRGAMNVPEPVAKRLSSCLRPSAARLKPVPYTMSFNVHVTNKGKAVSAYIKESTLGERNIEACMVAVLRETRWPVADVADAVPATPGARAFFAQPAEQIPDSPGPKSGTYPKGTYPQQAPQGQPDVGRFPRIFLIPLSPLAAGAAVFGIIFFWSDNDAPGWASEMNPITRQPYTSLQEYEAVKQLTRQQIRAAQATAAAAKPTTTTAPPPAPQSQPQPAQPAIAATSSRPAGSSPCPPCPTPPPNDSRRDTGHKHWPCKGDHTHYYRYDYNQNPKTCQCFLKAIETHVECH